MRALSMPAVSAAGSGQSWNNTPEHIAALKAYTAYSGDLIRAKMNGAGNAGARAGAFNAPQQATPCP